MTKDSGLLWRLCSAPVVLALLLCGGAAFVAIYAVRTQRIGGSGKGAPAAATNSSPDLNSTRIKPVTIAFGTEPSDLSEPPQLAEISIPAFAGAHAIWGSLGRDQPGRIWFGVSAQAGADASAHLFCYDPGNGQVRDRGDVLTQLQRASKRQQSETQMKIHSRIVQAADGQLYFASMDEQGERVDGSRLPDWGSHLWRLDPAGDRWEHLAAVPEALIAVSGVGRYVYALGYFGHVLYQYDTKTGVLRRVRVGAADGHISRNFLSDAREHVYVPRVQLLPAKSPGNAAIRFKTELVELDESLQEVGQTPLFHYGATLDDSSHGIIGFVHLADLSMVFATHEGFLYRVVPHQGRAAEVRSLGWFHPEGTAYTPSLFTFSGRRYVVGVGQRPRKPFEWIVYDLETQSSQAVPLAFQGLPFASGRAPLLYGSNVWDLQGRFYLGGTVAGKPVLLRVSRLPPSPPARPPGADSAPADVTVDGQDKATTGQPDTGRLANAILQGTGETWLAASEADKQEMARLIAGWLHAPEPEAVRQQWARRYYEELENLSRRPGANSGKLADWLPVLHARMVGSP